MLPPESLPRPSGDPPAAMIAASPLLLTPGDGLMSYGLRVRVCRGLQLFSPWIGGQFVLPIKIAPARRIRATTVASWSGMRLRRMRRPAVVGRPAVLKMSLTVNGTPCSGPSALPRVLWRSAVRASLIALSAVAKTTAFRRGFTGWMCSRCARTTSTAESFLVRIARAIQPAGAPITSRIAGELSRSRSNLNWLDGIPRIDVEPRHAGAHQLLKLARVTRKDWEGAEVHRHDRLDPQKRHRLRGTLGTHGVEATDRQKRDVELAKLGDDAHVAEDVGVAGEVDAESVLEFDHQAACLPAVNDPAVVDDALLALGAPSLPGPVTDPGEADVSVQRHRFPPLMPTGKADFPTRPKQRSRPRRQSTDSERTARKAGAKSRAGRPTASPA